ncbi:MAG: aldolase/citrate lyase family protein [Hyphomicrobiales bacterium]
MTDQVGGPGRRFVWLTLPGGLTARAIARAAGLPCLVDMQHGQIGYAEMVDMITHIAATGQGAYVRPPLGDFGMSSRALDAGATAIVCPMVNTVEDARRLVEATKFPPVGTRSWGPGLAADVLGLDLAVYLKEANGRTAVFAMIETEEALRNVAAIAAVEGIDGLFVGPYDLSISLLGGAAFDPRHPRVEAALKTVADAARANGKRAGVYCSNAAEAAAREALGFTFNAACSDQAVLKAGAAAMLGGA